MGIILNIKTSILQTRNSVPYVIKLEEITQRAVLLLPDGKIVYKQYDQYGGAGSRTGGIFAKIQYGKKIKEAITNAKKQNPSWKVETPTRALP